MYKNENGRYTVKETDPEPDILYPQELEHDESDDSRAWNVVREYEGFFSAKKALEEIIRIHMEGRINA